MATAQLTLTDEELFTELKRSGMMPGPVTENTRPVYLKKLKKLREDQRHRLGKGRVVTNNNNNIALVSGLLESSGAYRDGLDITHKRGGGLDNQSPLRDSGKMLLGFSSDESDADAGPGKQRGRVVRGSTPQSERCPAQRGSVTEADGRKAPDWWETHRPHCPPGRDNDEEGGEATKSLTLNGNRLPYYRDYSDSDEEDLGKDVALGRKSRRSITKPTRSNGMDEYQSLVRPQTEEAGVSPRHRGVTRKSFSTDRNEEHRKTNNHLGSSYNQDVSTGYLTSNSISPRISHPNHSTSNHSHLPLLYTGTMKKQNQLPEEELLQQFKREEVSPPGGFSAHYLSMFLLTAACLFFLLLGLTYLRMRGTVLSGEENLRNQDDQDSFAINGRNLLMNTLHKLHDKLAKTAGDHICGHSDHPKLSIQETTEYLMELGDEYASELNKSLEWILHSGKDVGIKCSGDTDSIVTIADVTFLESTQPQMSFSCRIRRAFITVVHRLSLLLLVVGLILGLLRYLKYRWTKEEEETRQMYDMVVKIIDVLKSNNEACRENKDLQPYMPISHVRDSFIQPCDRYQGRWLNLKC
ncbi:inner nuclear membrane protein Man1 [Bombina bombina]|uniref:inner nuclear membrane protein Man1 n=1 Tax=Bombina bombina TaxID=8345 RepID=UPI00235A52CF|nr:inner nuclear membrane protein Man1 [Bombina bombina]